MHAKKESKHKKGSKKKFDVKSFPKSHSVQLKVPFYFVGIEWKDSITIGRLQIVCLNFFTWKKEVEVEKANIKKSLKLKISWNITKVTRVSYFEQKTVGGSKYFARVFRVRATEKPAMNKVF